MGERPSQGDTAGVLTAQFGGTWHPHDTDALPGVIIWAQLRQDADGRHVLTGLLMVGDGITAAHLRRVPIAEMESGTRHPDGLRAELDPLPPLRRDGRDGEQFANLVAAHYRVWARYVSHPAAAMADEWGVRLPTMHGLIREARLRGLLPMAHRGKRAAD